MGYKWKNQDLKTYGIIVEKIPTISKAKKKIEVMQIDGRNGFLSIDTGTYEPFNAVFECHCDDTANLEEIKTFLDGYGTLSFDGVKQYTAIIDNAIPFESILPRFKKFQVNFLVNPIAEKIEPTTVSLLNVESLDITTYADVYPIIEITATGNISLAINNDIFYLDNTDGTYILDCKNKVITDSNGTNKSGIMRGNFPTLKNGTNNINYNGTISDITLTYRETYL